MAGKCNFYEKVGHMFEAAKKNAPAVVFLDDADVLFEEAASRGFYRYLLTNYAGRTRIRQCGSRARHNDGDEPRQPSGRDGALGRVELWLETQLPNAEARMAS
jgi:hypothetical protein